MSLTLSHVAVASTIPQRKISIFCLFCEVQNCFTTYFEGSHKCRHQISGVSFQTHQCFHFQRFLLQKFHYLHDHSASLVLCLPWLLWLPDFRRFNMQPRQNRAYRAYLSSISIGDLLQANKKAQNSRAFFILTLLIGARC